MPAARSVPFFLASLAFAVTFGAGLGACMLASMTLPWNVLHGLSLASVKTAHGYAQVFGFATLFVMGVAYHVIPRFKAVELATPRLAAASFWLQTGGVLVVALGALGGEPLATATRIAGSAALLVAALAFAWTVHCTLAAPAGEPQRFERWVRAGCLWLVVATALGLTVAVGMRAWLQSAAWEAALWGFAGSWLFGMSSRILPVFMGLLPPREQRTDWIFRGYQVAVVVWVTVAIAEAWTLVPIPRALAGAALSVTATLFVLRLGVLGPREHSEGDAHGYAKFIVTAYTWLLAAIVFAPAWTAAAALNGGGVPTFIYDFGRHAFTLGFLTQMIIGVSMRVVPVFAGGPLWSPVCREAAYYLLNAAVLTRGLQVVVELTGLVAVWPYIALSGVLGWAAFVVFALNVVMTLRARTPAPAVADMRRRAAAQHAG